MEGWEAVSKEMGRKEELGSGDRRSKVCGGDSISPINYLDGPPTPCLASSMLCVVGINTRLFGGKVNAKAMRANLDISLLLGCV